MNTPSGWLLVIAIPTTVLLAYLLRPTGLSRALGLIEKRAHSYLGRMRPHYWLGYAIAAVALFHAWVAMSTTPVGRLNATGLYLATGALILVFAQVMLGRQLRDPAVENRRALRRWHFRSMVGIVVLALGHVALNSPGYPLLVGR